MNLLTQDPGKARQIFRRIPLNKGGRGTGSDQHPSAEERGPGGVWDTPGPWPVPTKEEPTWTMLGRAMRPPRSCVRTASSLLDSKNRLRAILETGSGEEGGIEAGLRILDRHGSERIIVGQMAWGALVSFAHEGETVALIECADDMVNNPEPGTQIALCDRSADTKLRWFVSLDGKVIEEECSRKSR